MRQIVLFLLLLPGFVFAQGNPNYDSDFDNNDCYTVMDVLSLLVILMPDDAGMESMNPNYDPDYDGDGVIDIGDLTHLLALFGNCEEAPACSSPSMDGYNYSVVQIGDQCWFAENLRTSVYADGTEIPSGLNDSEWGAATSGATSVYGEGDSDCFNYSPDIDACDEAQALEEYGRLYNWYAVDDALGLCPSGWHVATQGDWTDLENHVSAQGFSGSEATALKSTYGWRTDIPGTNTNGTDDFGFLGLPGGLRAGNGQFDLAGSDLNLWSSSPTDTYPWSLILNWGYPIFLGDNLIEPQFGLSVRCLRDADYTEVQGCTDPAYTEYDASANVDDGSCATLASPCESPSTDGYTYDVVQIGDQCWFAENLRTTTYLNGDPVPNVEPQEEWLLLEESETGAWASPYGDPANQSVHGLQYNFYAVRDGRNLCPPGWVVPSDEDWGGLEIYLGIPEAEVYTSDFRGVNQGSQLKATPDHPDAPWDGIDSVGMTMLASGHRTGSGGWHGPGLGLYWTSDPWSSSAGTYRSLYTSNPKIRRANTQNFASGSIRCIQKEDSCYDPDGDGICPEDEIGGCTDPEAENFDLAATEDDGSCMTAVGSTCESPSMDGYTYEVVQIGDQCWFAENLRTTTYRNGDVIPAGLTDGEWTSTTSGATAVYGEGSSDCYNSSPDIDACDEVQSLAEYGRLYNWHAVDDARGLCPVGWHVPTDEEWTDLEDFITAQGFSGTEGTALKSTYGWNYGGNGTDDFGFSALPGGFRNLYDGNFDYAGGYGDWWSSSPSGGDAWYRYLSSSNPDILRYDSNPRSGFSVRCLRDAD